MSFRRKLKFFLVHHSGISNKEADELIKSGKIYVNGQAVFENLLLTDECQIKKEETLLREPKTFKYYLFHKPRGIESTLNKNIANNLHAFIPQHLNLFPAGRLDKDSEGLMLLTNDGNLYKKITGGSIEKEYRVETDKELHEEFKNKMEAGILLDGALTKPCVVELLNQNTFKIILTEGKYRQIRRMSFKCGYVVTRLVRTRIDKWELNNLKPGEIREVIASKI